MIKLTYGKRFRPVSDFEVDELFEQIREITWDYSGGFSTANIFNRIRLGIVNDEISADAVTFIFEGQEMSLGFDGDVDNWVSGFLTRDAETARGILLGGSKKRIERRGNKTTPS